MKITKGWLVSKKACGEGVFWFENQNQTDTKSVAETLLSEGRFAWANWLITQKMDKANCVKYAIYEAEKVLHIYEEKYPNDDRPKQAILAARRYLKIPSEKNRVAAARAADASADAAAYFAADAADAARAAAHAAARAAAHAAVHTSNAARAAAYFAARAADAAVYASAYSVKIELHKEIIAYGLKLLSQQEGKPRCRDIP